MEAGTSATVVALFAGASLAIKVVVVLLLAALIAAAVITFAKLTECSRVKADLEAFERHFWSGPSIDELYASISGKRHSAAATIFMAGMYEWRRTLEMSPHAPQGVLERMERLMTVAIARESDRLRQWLVVLPITVSAGPLLGLAAASWSIMSALAGAASGNDAVLSAMASRIAQGLFALATACFVAAVAKLCHGVLARRVGRLEQQLRDFAQEFSVIASRQTHASA